MQGRLISKSSKGETLRLREFEFHPPRQNLMIRFLKHTWDDIRCVLGKDLWLLMGKKLLFNKIAAVYGLFFNWQVKSYRRVLHNAKVELDFSAYQNIIDIGCGTGALCKVLREHGIGVTIASDVDILIAGYKDFAGMWCMLTDPTAFFLKLYQIYQHPVHRCGYTMGLPFSYNRSV